MCMPTISEVFFSVDDRRLRLSGADAIIRAQSPSARFTAPAAATSVECLKGPPSSEVLFTSTVVARYYRELQSLLARTLKDRHAAEDVAQESYLRMLALQESGRTVTNTRSVLYRTAYNLVIDAKRRARVRDHDDIDALTEEAQPSAPESTQPDVILSSAQRAQAMVQTIEALPPRCREAFVLHKIDGLSQPEVAARMGISLNMVERHIMRGMDACRACRDRLDGRA